MESSAPTSSTGALLNVLTNRGWFFNDLTQIRPIIAIHSAIHGDSFTIESLESELCNLDLRSIGGKSLPDSSILRKASQFLQPPKVLQVKFSESSFPPKK